MSADLAQPVVVAEPDGAATLDAVLVALGGGQACAVLDPSWPVALRDAALRALGEAVEAGRLRPGDLAVFTSGSAGRPRGVVRSVDSWRASAQPLAALAGIGEADVVWVPGPMSSSLFLHGAWHAAHVGATPAPGREPPREATVLHAVPALLDAALDAADAGALPAMRTAVVAGDALPPATRRRAAAAGWRVVEYYGAAELSFVAWRGDEGTFRAFPGADVDIRGGEVWVRSPYLGRGYLDPRDAGPLRVEDGWATVGDLARPAAEGGFHLIGRGSAAVVTGGHTVVAEEVEAALRRVPDVLDAVVVGLPHPRLGALVAACVVPAAGEAPASLLPGLLDAARRLPAPARPRRWYALDAVPRLPSGKADRAAALDAVASGRAVLLRPRAPVR